MDSDIRENLKEVGNHLQDVARQVSSPKSSEETIKAMKGCLTSAAETLEVYLRVQQLRHQ